MQEFKFYKKTKPTGLNIVIYATRFDKSQYIVPDWQYTRYYYFLVQVCNCRVAIEDWTAAMATAVLPL